MILNNKKFEWGKELLLTWSKYKGVLSSKKIIQNCSFTFGSLIILSYHTSKIMCWKICEGYTATDVAILAGTFFTIGGFTTDRIFKEKVSGVEDKPIEH